MSKTLFFSHPALHLSLGEASRLIRRIICLSTNQNANPRRDRQDRQNKAHVHKTDRQEWQDPGENEPNPKQQHAQITGLNPFHNLDSP
jgi:hypothetical protein